MSLAEPQNQNKAAGVQTKPDGNFGSALAAERTVRRASEKPIIRIRLISNSLQEWHDARIRFDCACPLEECAGLFLWGAMVPEFLAFLGPRAWFLDEPRAQSMWHTPIFRKAVRQLAPPEFLHHSNPDPRYRFPCVTHYGEPTCIDSPRRIDAAIAVVNNFGGRIWWIRDFVVGAATNFAIGPWLRQGVRVRNSFILQPCVELFGSPESWNQFRRWPWSKSGAPANYRGHLGTNLAQYRIVICLENASLPYYFTEKLVNAARAGCVPVYHAHPTVRDTFLKGARWIDPADFGYDPSATLAAARRCDFAEVQERNRKWLQSDAVKATQGERVWSRIADHFVERITSARLGSQCA
jgi:hypothetical protein